MSNIYKAVKNYMHNELGYSEKELKEVINKAIEDAVKKEVRGTIEYILKRRWLYYEVKRGIDSVIEQEVKSIIKELKV